MREFVIDVLRIHRVFEGVVHGHRLMTDTVLEKTSGTGTLTSIVVVVDPREGRRVVTVVTREGGGVMVEVGGRL